MVFLLIGLLSFSVANAQTSKNMNQFIHGLMSKMTLEEKVGQLTQYSAELSKTGASINKNYRDEIIKGHVGSIFNAFTPKFTRHLQELAVTKTRLKIPLLFAFDVIHGHRTIFPIPLGASSTWDPDLIEKSERIAATEAAADGIHWVFAPMVDIARDPRWGRISEGAGEDPYLGARIARAEVRGLQGKKLGALNSVVACVKHFAAYGAPIGGRDYNSVDMSERTLKEVYLPPYKAAVDAGVATLMPSFNDIAGVPSTANPELLTKILRKKWKFKGLVVSDYTAIKELIAHGLAADGKQAALLAFKAGTDMDMQSGLYMKYLPALVRAGKIPMSMIDRSVHRVLELKYKLGLFKDPYRYSNEARAKKILLSKGNRAFDRKVERRSIVLLKNDKSVLPLKKSGTIALIGPFIDNKRDMIGNWSAAGEPKDVVTLRQGMTDVAGKHVNFVYALGANILDKGKLEETLNKYEGDLHVDPRPDKELVDEAVKVAKKADVVVLALGESQGMSGEAAARTHLRLPANQEALLKALKEKAGKPIILVLSNGRPLVLTHENKLASAIVETWFLGTESGHAIADVLFGDFNPSGHLTVSFPYDEGQIPIYYSHRNTGRPFDADNKYTSKYLDAPVEPLYPFGYGLSYTTFSYSTPRLSAKKMKRNGQLTVHVTVKNTGDRDGRTTVQLYIRDMVASVTQPVKKLRGFKNVFLRKGESRDVEFTLDVKDLEFLNRKMKWVAEPGQFKVMTGGNSRDVKEASFRL